MIKIYCKNLQQTLDVDGGTSLLEISHKIATQLDFYPICARVNNKVESLEYQVFAPKDVEFLDRNSDSGHRAYMRSLCMMLYAAVRTIYPGVRMRIEHSISHGVYVHLEGVENPDAEALAAEMRRLNEASLPFVRHEERMDDVLRLFNDNGLDDKVLLLESLHLPYSTFYTLGNVADSYYGCLAPTTAEIDVFSLTPYKQGLLLCGFDRKNPANTPQPVEQQKMFKAFTDYLEFNRIMGVRNVGELNRAVDAGQAAELINVAEAMHEKYISRISDEIARRHRAGGARVVLIAGPSSSGKTTTTKRLAIQLMTNLLKPVMLSLDNYFIDREHTPRDESGDYDYESLYALDLEQFNSDLNRIIAGQEVEIPTYSFELGRRQYKGNKVRLDADSVLLIEGIHGLNPELTAHIDEKQKFRIYVSALTTLSIDDHNWVPTSDNRLLRRLIRDAKYRGTSALDTLRRWPSVRRGEERWIFPYQENADATFNSSLLFELGVMRDYADELLRQVPSDCVEYARAYRLRKFLSYFRPIPAKDVPPTSLLREFLGGSSFHY